MRAPAASRFERGCVEVWTPSSSKPRNGNGPPENCLLTMAEPPRFPNTQARRFAPLPLAMGPGPGPGSSSGGMGTSFFGAPYAPMFRFGAQSHGGPSWFGPVPAASSSGRGSFRAPRKKSKKQETQPSLNQLQRENKIKTRKHYRGPPGTLSRWSVPRAPEHSTDCLFPTPDQRRSPSGLHFVTPAANFASAQKGYWRNGLGSIDPQAAEIGAAAGIDMFGSNAGLVARGDSAEDSQDEDPYGFELHVEENPETGDLPAAVRQRMDEQSAYCCQLEETNLKLQERIFLLEQQLGEMQAHGANGAGGNGDKEEDMAHSSGSAGHHGDEAHSGSGDSPFSQGSGGLA